MMETIQIVNITPEEFETRITNSIKSQLESFIKNLKPQHPNDYLTRKEVAKLFSVNLSTLHHWNKSGKLTPLGLGSRVYYLRSDIDKALTPLNPEL